MKLSPKATIPGRNNSTYPSGYELEKRLDLACSVYNSTSVENFPFKICINICIR